MINVWDICTGCNVIYLKWLKNGSWSMITRSGSKRDVKIRHVWRMWIKSAAIHCPWGDADHAWPRRALSQRGAQGTPSSGTMVAGTRNGPWARLAGRSAILDAVYLKRLVMIVLFDGKTHKMFNTDFKKRLSMMYLLMQISNRAFTFKKCQQFLSVSTRFSDYILSKHLTT